MSISIKLLESNNQIQGYINRSLADQLNKKIHSNSKRVASKIKSMVPSWITEQQEIASLLSDGVPNSLNAQFGLRPGSSTSAAAAIIHAISETISVEISNVDTRLQGHVAFRIQPENFSNLLGLSEGYVQTITTSLHWLDWLLTMGGTPIITGYEYQPSNDGRSGGGTMVGGTVWRVPSEYTGVLGNNFVTRALENREKQISDVLKGLFT